MPENAVHTQWLLLLLLRSMQVPCLNFKQKCIPLRGVTASVHASTMSELQTVMFPSPRCYCFGPCKNHVWTSNRNVPLSETTVRMGHFSVSDRLVGLVVRRPPRERKIPGSNPACAGIFSGSSHTSDFKVGTPVATLPGAWRYRVSTGTGRPGVSSILWLGEVDRLICNIYLSVAARKIVWADPSLRYTSLLLGR